MVTLENETHVEVISLIVKSQFMLAAVSIGAIFTGDLPFLGSQAVINKLKQVNPKILLTIDRFMYNRQEINLLDNIKEIADGLPSLEQVLIVPSKSVSKENDISSIKKSSFLDDFLQLGLDDWGNVAPLEFEQVSFSHPVTINFTSGTTGLPKPIVHGCGALFPAAKDFVLQLDCDRDSIWFAMSPVGWVSWHMIITVTFCGVGVFLFEGYPYFLSPTYYWDLVDRYEITHLYLSPSALDRMEKLGYAPSDKNHLSSLKACISASSIVKPKDYDFMYTKVKKDIAFAAAYGATEIMGTCMSLELTTSVYTGELPALCLGNDVQCVNEKGEPVEGEYGNLVIAKSCPNFFLGIWGDSNRSIARKNYFSKFDGKFSLGDFGIVNPFTKGFLICGRSDATLNQRGIRFGGSEIYNVLDSIPEVRDSVCVSKYNTEMDESAVLFLQLKTGCFFNESLIQLIREANSTKLSPFHIPDVIYETKQIPYNANGKKMEIIVKNIINNRPYNADNLINPECLKNFHEFSKLGKF